MFYPFRKLIVALLAIWLPLFTGNALAMSIVMQPSGKACHVKVAPRSVQHEQRAVGHQHDHMNMAMDMAMDMAASQDQQTVHSVQQVEPDAADQDCAICHLACCSYLAAVISEIPSLPFAAQQFMLTTLQFQSISLTPLDPPPLARV